MKYIVLLFSLLASTGFSDSKTDTTIVPKKAGGSVIIKGATITAPLLTTGAVDTTGAGAGDLQVAGGAYVAKHLTAALNSKVIVSATGSQTSNGSGEQQVSWGTPSTDVNSEFASNKFTPKTPGYYVIHAFVREDSKANGGIWACQIRKNGTTAIGRDHTANNTGGSTSGSKSLSGMDYFNGTTDYVDISFYDLGSATVSSSSRFVAYRIP